MLLSLQQKIVIKMSVTYRTNNGRWALSGRPSRETCQGMQEGLGSKQICSLQQSPEVPSAGKPFLPGRNSSWKFLGGHLLCWLLLLTNYTDLIKGCTKERKQSIPIVWLDGDSGFRLLFYSHFGKTLQDASVFAMSYMSSGDFGEKGTVFLTQWVQC